MKVFDILCDQLQGQTVFIPSIGKEIEVISVIKRSGDCLCTISDGNQSIDLYPQTEFEIL